MAILLKYFKKSSFPTSNEAGLSDTFTREVNNGAEEILEEERSRATGRKWKYTHFTLEGRARIGKFAAQCGYAPAVKHFTKEFPTVGESKVHLLKKQYQADLKKFRPE